MFGRRSDGKLIKTIDPFSKMMPHIMPERNDAMVMALYEIDCKKMDEYIFEKRRNDNVRFNYMHVLVSAMVRVLALRPRINRFIINRRIYRRNNIQVSIAVKKALLDSAEETTIKLTFTGKENIFEVKEIMDKEVEANTTRAAFNETDKTAKTLMKIPNFITRSAIGFLKWLDRHGMLPKKLIAASPFHTSLFLTNMKSIKMDYVYHHIYNFGTTSIFISMGKEKYEPVVLDAEKAEIGVAKILKAGMVIDERVSDGLYNSLSLREFKKLMENPWPLEEKLEAIVEDIE